MSTPQDIPDNVTSAIVPAGTLLLFVGQQLESDSGGVIRRKTPIYVKNPNSTYSEVGGGWGEKTINGLKLKGNALEVGNGTTYNSLNVSSNVVSVFNGGTINNLQCTSGQTSVYAGGIINSGIVNGGSMWVNVQGQIDHITASGTGIDVNSGGILKNTVINSGGGGLRVFYGGSASNITLNFNAPLQVFSSGTVDSVTVNYGCIAKIEQGDGKLLNIIENGGSAGGNDGWATTGSYSFLSNTFSDLTIGQGGVTTVHSGTIAVRPTLSGSNARLYVHSGGVVSSPHIISGNLIAYAGGNITGSTIMDGGYLDIYANITNVIQTRGTFQARAGAVVNVASVSVNGSMLVYSGASTDSATIDSGGIVYLYGNADNTTVSSGGTLIVYTGGIASNVVSKTGANVLDSGGSIHYKTQ